MWYGVIFLRQGFYVDGVFRFTILLPDKFPDDKILPVSKWIFLVIDVIYNCALF